MNDNNPLSEEPRRPMQARRPPATQARHWPRRRPRRARTGTATCARSRSWRTTASAWSGSWTMPASMRSSALPRSWSASRIRWRRESAAGTANSGSALLEGSTATLKQLLRAFDKAGIKVIDPLGQPFDPAWHEAMVAQESRDAPPNTVLVGDSERLFPEWPAAAPGTGRRQQGTRRGRQLKNTPHVPKYGHNVSIFRGFSQWVK